MYKQNLAINNLQGLIYRKTQPSKHNWGNKGLHAFLKGIGPKVNIIARLGFELAYYDNQYVTETHPLKESLMLDEKSPLNNAMK